MSKLQALSRLVRWRQQPRDARGRWVKAAARVSARAVHQVKSRPEMVSNLAVNTAGFAASVAGGAIAGPVGKFAGDLAGALVARKVVIDAGATYSAYQKLKVNSAFEKADRLQKLMKLREEAIAELKNTQTQQKAEESFTEDVVGWGVGNLAAETLNATVQAIAPIPFKGAAVALATVPRITPKIIALRKKLRGRKPKIRSD